jgi:ribosomal protein S18 acetylase RimI-like enzyme
MAMQKRQYAVRPAHKRECRRIAELYRISSDGVADYIWTKLAQPGEDILDVGRKRYEREGTPFSYENCKLVEFEGSVVAMLVAFPMEVDEDYEETDPILLPYSVLEEDQSYYICGMAVDQEHRGKGVGTMLLEEAERSCERLGLSKLSLIVFEQNVRARLLYERYGYVETRRHPVVPHPLIHYTGDALLMVKGIGHSRPHTVDQWRGMTDET